MTVCFECEQVWPSERALRRAYRRAEWRMVRCYEPYWYWPIGLVKALRTRRLNFCPECLHDF
jgi:hypothetical protein